MATTTYKTLLAILLTGTSALTMVAPSAAPQYGYITMAAASKSAAAEEAQSRYGGKVLKVEQVSEGGRTVYRVKLLLDGGRIKIVTVNTNNG